MLDDLRTSLEKHQVVIYFVSIAAGVAVAFALPQATVLESFINPALALMLFVTFLQIPLSDLPKSFLNQRFLACLIVVNFIIMPLVVAVLAQFLPLDPMVRLAVLLVLLAPCIDYVVTFTHLGEGDAKTLLAATPLLLILQMLLLPLYLGLLLGSDVKELIRPEPFITAFIWLIAIPLLFAGIVQAAAARANFMAQLHTLLLVLPVPSTALVLLLVLASVIPRVGDATTAALAALPIYLTYALVAPLCGWCVAQGLRVNQPAALAVAFSAATRNSLVVMPFAFVIPGGVPVIPAVIVTQTVVELLSELVYVRVLKRLPVRSNS